MHIVMIRSLLLCLQVSFQRPGSERSDRRWRALVRGLQDGQAGGQPLVHLVATRCCCCGCVLGGSSCPSPTSPTSGVRHELRAGPLLHRPGGDPGLGNPPIPICPPSLPCAPFSSSSCEFWYAAAVCLAAPWRTVS